jgi:ABC-type transport system involved in multi-copper enzyme maturation permease subunit
MFHKVLWSHNWKQAKYVILAMWIVFFFTLPFDYLTLITRNYEQGSDGMSLIYYGKGLSIIGPIPIMIVLALFAAFLLNGKRNNGSLKFQFSLPFSRKELFLAKWLFGTVHILLVLAMNIVITVLIIETSFIRNYEDVSHWPMYFLFASFAYVSIYSVCLFVGTFTGRIISQVLLSFLLLFIGQIGLMLIKPFLHVLLQKPKSELYSYDSIHLIDITTLPNMMNGYRFWNEASYDGTIRTNPLSYFKVEYPTYDTLIAAAIITGLSIFIGTLIFSRNKLERNGQFLLFKKLEPFYIALVTIIVALFGGVLSSGSSYLYFFYFFGFGAVMYFILRLLFKRNTSLPSQQPPL